MHSFSKNENMKTHFKRKWNLEKEGSLSSLKEDLNSTENISFSYKDGLYCLLTGIICIASSVFVTALPVENVIINPERWYEVIFSTISSNFFTSAAVVLQATAVINPFRKNLLLVILDLFLFRELAFIIGLFITHLIWSNFLGYFEPCPLRCSVIGLFVATPVFLLRLWKLISKEKDADSTFKKRRRAFLCFFLWNTFVVVQLSYITKLFRFTPHDLQWMIAPIVPFSKIINDYIVEKILIRAASPETVAKAKMIGIIHNNVSYSFWLAISLATTVTTITGFILIGINFVINLTLCFKVIRLNNNVSLVEVDIKRKNLHKKQVIGELWLNEIVEIIVPIAFIGSYASAYFGPNKDVIGDVGCNIWQYKRVKDIQSFFIPVVQMAMIDSGSLILAAIILWHFCRINILQELGPIVRKYWYYVAADGAGFLGQVSNVTIFLFWPLGRINYKIQI